MKHDTHTTHAQQQGDDLFRKPGREILVVKAADADVEDKPFLDRLSDEDRKALIRYVPVQKHARGAVVFREGDLGQALYIIWSGRVAILKEESDAKFTLLAYRNAGDIVGEMGVIGNRPRSASVVVAEDAELIKINSNAFHNLVQEHPAINMKVLEVLSDRLRAADETRTQIAQATLNLGEEVNTLTEQTKHLTSLAQMQQQNVDLIVHDLRNPTGIVKTSLDLLQKVLGGDDLDYQRQILNVAQHSTERLLTMIEAMLEAARQEQIGVTLNLEIVDLNRVLDNALASVRPVAEQHNLILTQEAGDLPSLVLDVDKLQRVVTNLLDNAITYTPDGGSITLSAQVEEETVTVCVTDTGPGVPPEHRERIFERFGRVPERRGRKRGFGLGLYFCREVVRAHGGRIWVEPGPGDVGSRFTFTLPVTTNDQTP